MQVALRERYGDPLFPEQGMDRKINLTFDGHPVIHVHPIKKPEKKSKRINKSQEQDLIAV